jgi:G3E family GTPase
VDETMLRQTQLDAVVTVVDAKYIWNHWDSSEAQEQIAFADVILLNKNRFSHCCRTEGPGK